MPLRLRRIAAAAGSGAPPDPGETPPPDGPPDKSPAAPLGQRRARPGRRRGRPRSERADQVILIAAAEIMAEKGVHGLSIEEVAARAGVGKTTIYRRWSSRGTLALDAFLAEFPRPAHLPDTGTLVGDLREALGSSVNAFTRPSGAAMLVGLLAEIQQDRDLAVAWQDQVSAPQRAQYSILLDRAVSRGEIPAEIDAGIVIDMMFGACYYRLLQHGQLGRRPLNEQFVSQVVKMIAAGLGAPTDLPDPLQRHRSMQAVADLDDRCRRAREQFESAGYADRTGGDSGRRVEPAHGTAGLPVTRECGLVFARGAAHDAVALDAVIFTTRS